MGEALAEGLVTAGPVGVVRTEVGVGTGGGSVGPVEPEREADGVPALGAALAGPPRRTGSTTETGFGPRGTQAPTDSGPAFVALTGALPSVPAPLGALTGGGAASGVPSAHPTVTAKGRPSVTRPMKTVLGVSRTDEHRTSAAKGYAGVGNRQVSTVHPLDQASTDPVLSRGSHSLRPLSRGER